MENIVLRERLAEAETAAVRLFRRLQRLPGKFSRYIRALSVDGRFLFKGAPMATLVVGNNTDATLASPYMEMMAESPGLGVLYSGFFAFALKVSGRLRKIAGLVIGYPDIRCRRVPLRKQPRVRER